MGIDQNGRSAAEGLNVYALVIYIPGALGRFLDDLRRELVPHYNPHAHVSVLPPRTIAGDWHGPSEQARALTEGYPPFEVELSRLEVFPDTEVLYLEVGLGAEHLRQMHRAMNTGVLEFKEPFAYHPHITLAQEIPHDDLPAIRELAERRWAEYQGERVFRADRAVFVQNTKPDCWVDLAEYSLGRLALK